MSRLGELRADNDANCTYEGENTVLIQQASNWLLSQWKNILDGKEIVAPWKSVNFLKNANEILLLKFNCTTVEQTMDIESNYLKFN